MGVYGHLIGQNLQDATRKIWGTGELEAGMTKPP
jgi:hypothetical protein